MLLDARALKLKHREIRGRDVFSLKELVTTVKRRCSDSPVCGVFFKLSAEGVPRFLYRSTECDNIKMNLLLFSRHHCFILRVSRWFATWPCIGARCGPGCVESVGVLVGCGGVGGGLGARSELLVPRRLAHGRLADSWSKASGVSRRTREPVARLGEDLLLLPAVVTHPDHLGNKEYR